MKNQMKGKKGITLIALVITIVVLLILTGVTISTLTGDNGLLTKASKATKDTQINSDKEILQTAILASIDLNTLNVSKDELISNLNGWQVNGDGPFTCISTNGNEFNVSINGIIDEKKSYDGKKVSILGDSISTLKGYIPQTNRARYVQTNAEATNGLIYISYEDTWWGRTINSTNMILGINESWAGSCVSNTSTSNSGDEGPDRHMASMTRLEHLDDNGTPDVILFYGGTNDIGKNKTKGTFDSTASYVNTLDTTSTTYSSFVEAYTIAIKRMQYLYPNAEIICILPTYTTSYYNTSKLMEYNNEIKKICNCFSIKCIDLTQSGITTSKLVDGIHPNPEGMEIISNYIVNSITTSLNEQQNNNNDNKIISGTRITANDNAENLPEGITSTTNLWSALTPKNIYYNGSSWSSESFSITFPVIPGDKIVSNSMKSTPENGGQRNGIRITFFNDNNVIESRTPDQIYDEYVSKGYITVPDGANCINVPSWSGSDTVYLNPVSNNNSNNDKILSGTRSTANDNAENLPEGITSTTNLWSALTPKNIYYNGSSWSSESFSITFPVIPGDKIVSNSMKGTPGNGGTRSGIRITFFNDNNVIESRGPDQIYNEFVSKGYITVPEGANCINLPSWSSSDNVYFIIN